MKNLFNPKWIFLVNTFPVIVLAIIFSGEYKIIHSLLSETNIEYWKSFSIVLLIATVVNVFVALFLMVRKNSIPKWYHLLMLVFYISYSFMYMDLSRKIFPFSIPRWMMPEKIDIFVYTFLMPTIVYSLFALVGHFTFKKTDLSAKKNLSIAGIILFVWFVIFRFGDWVNNLLRDYVDVCFDFFHVIGTIIMIVSTVAFMFYLIRGVFILLSNYDSKDTYFQYIFKIVIGITLPIVGLFVNTQFNNIFGNFVSSWFYIMAFINGVLLCLPDVKSKRLNLFVFSLKSITFSYVFYFFLVFLPYLPLSIIAIIFLGAGFLMMTPLILFMVSIKDLYADFKFLKSYYSNWLLSSILVLGFLVIPLILTQTYIKDKTILSETLEYIDSPNYTKDYSINNKKLESVIENIEASKSNFFGSAIPYLSTYYNWLVFDNLTISDNKITTIKKIFFGMSDSERRIRKIPNRSQNVNISRVSSRSIYDENQNAWKSTIELNITNDSASQGEYMTNIELPEGCWISDYYLFIEGEKEYGILAEKKAALWVYSQIVNVRRDPGILYYQTGNKVDFRVFPVNGNETRTTGIEFIHKEPIELFIDNNLVKLGNKKNKVNIEKGISGNTVYVSASRKAMLPKIKREPYFHFLIDISKENTAFKEQAIDRVESLLDKNLVERAACKIGFVNSEFNTIPYSANWTAEYKNTEYKGGFYIERAIQTALIKSYNESKNSYPIFIIVTDSFEKGIIKKDFSDLKITFPDNKHFYSLDENYKISKYSLTSKPTHALQNDSSIQLDNEVYEFQLNDKTVFLSNDTLPSIVINKTSFDVDISKVKFKDWQTALTLQGKYLAQSLNPKEAQKDWLNLIKYSFKSKILTPFTSYIVVENEAQKAILQKKQNQILSSNKSYDAGEEILPMSEPNYIFVALLFIVFLIVKNKELILNKIKQ